MNPALLATALLLAPFCLISCVQEGHSADCKFSDMGGAANVRDPLEEEGCLTPIGGACLSEEEFKLGRPAKREDDRGDEFTVEEDWIAYQCERPLCFDCMTQDEFEENCPDKSWSTYTELLPECE